MSKNTCYLCSQRFNVKSGWCNCCETYPDVEFCPHFIPRIEMEEAAVQYFRTGKLPDEWQGIQSSDYYYIVDEEKGLIKFDKSDDFYLLLKSTLIRYGVDIDVDNTLDHLNDIEFIFFDEIESALIERRGHKTQMNIDDAYIHALSAKDSNSASRLLELIFERDRRGLSVIKSN